MPTSVAARVSNAIGVLFVAVVVTEPIWSFIPWSLTPLTSPEGKIRFIISMILCHVGVFFWAISLYLLANLLRQKRWTGVLQSSALIAFCVWNAWGATHGVIRFWSRVFHWLV